MNVPAGVSPAPLDLDVVLSPEWLTAVLGVPVTGTEVVEHLVTIASKVRFGVTYGADPGDLPSSFCVKGYFAEQSRAMANVGQIETRFYTDLAPLLDLRVPPCVRAGIDPDTGHGMVLMRDLVADGARFLTALSPYSVDQAAGTLEQLARLHAADPSVLAPPDAGWLDTRFGSYLHVMTEDELQALLDDGRTDGLAPETAQASRLRAALAVLAERAAAAPNHYVHGDAHAGNLYLDSDGNPGLIDWQVVQLGPWAMDVAYHLVAVLEVAERERAERDLLDHYLGARRALGGDVPTVAEAWDAYRDALAYGYYMWGITRRVDRPIILAFVDRLGSAVEHHETFARLGV